MNAKDWVPETRLGRFACDDPDCLETATWKHLQDGGPLAHAWLCDQHHNELLEKEQCESTASADK